VNEIGGNTVSVPPWIALVSEGLDVEPNALAADTVTMQLQRLSGMVSLTH
jgi:hypothetical protein